MAADRHTAAMPLGLGSNILDAAPNTEKSLFDNAREQSDSGNEKSTAFKDGVAVEVDETEEDKLPDPYVPFPIDPGVPEEKKILRTRSIVLGLICGCLVNASNVYLGTTSLYAVLCLPSD